MDLGIKYSSVGKTGVVGCQRTRLYKERLEKGLSCGELTCRCVQRVQAAFRLTLSLDRLACCNQPIRKDAIAQNLAKRFEGRVVLVQLVQLGKKISECTVRRLTRTIRSISEGLQGVSNGGFPILDH